MIASPAKARRMAGFNLLELMVAVAIVGILVALGYPSYQSQLTDSRRNDAQGALLGFVTAMERYKSDNSTYAGAEAGTSFPSAPKATVYPAQAPIDSDDKYYTLTIESSSPTSYTLRATPIGGTAQDGDGFMEITSTGIKRWDKDNNGYIGSGETTWSSD